MTDLKSKSQARRERTLATRRRMVGAAYRLFCEKGYVATTIEAIAREAHVAVPTLYFTFRTKGAILGEVLGAAVMGFDEPVGPEDSSWYRAFEAEPDPRRALTMLVENTAPILRRVAPLLAATHAAAGDPEVTAISGLSEERRRAGYRIIVRQLAAKGGLRQGLTISRATDILLVLLGPQVFDALESGRGWSPVDTNRWVVEVLSQQLLPS
jgi:AcrR family transcriptional regulator